MKAAFVDHAGESITIGDVPVPTPAAGEVLVQVAASPVNFVDTLVRSGAYPTALKRPAIIGRDAVGYVSALGPGISGRQADRGEASGLETGDRVWTSSMGFDARPGTAAEFVAVPVERCYRVPDSAAGWSDAQLAATIHSSTTAIILAREVMKLKPGDTLIVEGAGGRVGSKLVEVAVDCGATVVATAGQRDHERLRQLGAMPVLYGEGFEDRVRGVLPGLADHVVDCSGRVSLDSNVGLLRPGGQMSIIAASWQEGSAPPRFDVRALYSQRKSMVGFVISLANVDELARASKVLADFISRGRLLDDQVDVRPLSAAAGAHEEVAGQTAGRRKIILVPRRI